ncbi:lactonase family protein [Arachidicoccus ginsenosidimutans]|uniref:lactonase family protein n=1 Tax=Arachidicoccus sp. BS20 TaxID=1850526 RepID=UPI0018D3C36C|nr:lactonase family protein [Arachidicoccus sp. BS20]
MSNNKEYVLAGTYTAGNASGGIYLYDFDEDSGTLNPVFHTENIFNPSYLALTKDEKYLYAVNENTDANTKGGVSAFAFDNRTGNINFLNSQLSNGDAPCFVSVDSTGKNVFVANYNGGNFSVYKTNDSGKLSPAVQIIAHSGTSANKKIQTQSHVHSTFLSPDEKYLFVCDLGNDTLYQYPFNANDVKPVNEANAKKYKVSAGFGPRHLVFSPNKKFVYLLNELEAKIIAYSFQNDSLTYLQTVTSTDVEDTANADKGSAAIRISPNGKFLYASNRGKANDITIFKIKEDGTLQEVAHVPTDKHPRDFNISPNGKFLLVAARDDNSIKIYKINEQTGLLTYTQHSVTLPMPVALIFATKK